MKFYKAKKGITIIALIITIIVLLILSGISITLIINNGNIMDMAKKAKDSMDNAQNSENEIISNYQNYIDKIVDGETNTYNVICYDVVNNKDGTRLGENTWKADSGEIVSGEKLGNDDSDNIYYIGYFYYSSTQETVNDTDVIVYRIFYEITPYLLRNGETVVSWTEYYQNHTTGSLTSYTGYKSFLTGSSLKYSNYHITNQVDLSPYTTVNIYGKINNTNTASGHFFVSSQATTTGVSEGYNGGMKKYIQLGTTLQTYTINVSDLNESLYIGVLGSNRTIILYDVWLTK